MIVTMPCRYRMISTRGIFYKNLYSLMYLLGLALRPLTVQCILTATCLCGTDRKAAMHLHSGHFVNFDDAKNS